MNGLRKLVGRRRRLARTYVVDRPSGTVVQLTAWWVGRHRRYRAVWCTGLAEDQLDCPPGQVPLRLNAHDVVGGVLKGTHLRQDVAYPLVRTLNKLWRERLDAPPVSYEEVDDEPPF